MEVLSASVLPVDASMAIDSNCVHSIFLNGNLGRIFLLMNVVLVKAVLTI